MLSWIREKFGTTIIASIIGFIAFVFIFYGVFSPKATRGLHEGSVAGTVNGDAITIAEFNREFQRRMEFFKNIGGGTLTEEQLKGFHVRESVFQELANRKMMLQEAQRRGLLAADDEVMEKVQEVPAFQKDGKFDFLTYKQVLEGNHYTPGGFENMIRDDLSMQEWNNYFKERIHVSNEEVQREFIVKNDKRNIKYVLLTPESMKKMITVDPVQVKNLLKDPNQLNLVKMKFQEGQKTIYKDMKLENVQEKIAEDILAGNKIDEALKLAQGVADQALPLLKKDKTQDAKLNALLKPYGVQVQSTGLVSRTSKVLPGIGEAKEVLADAFAIKSPIDGANGGTAKKYQVVGKTIIALVTESQTPDLASLGEQRESLLAEIRSRKSSVLYQEWIKKLTTKAVIEMNTSVVNSDS